MTEIDKIDLKSGEYILPVDRPSRSVLARLRDIARP